MITTKQFLKQGLQVGPWKVTRKVLLFIIAFCVVVLAFGVLMLETHAFDSEWDGDDDDDSNERYDDDDDDDGRDWDLGGGDMVMMVIMGLSGVAIMISLLACCFAQVNPPSHLDNRGAGGGQVFTIQLTKPSIGPQHSLNGQFYQYHQQQQQLHEQQHQQQLMELQRQRMQQHRRNNNSSNSRGVRNSPSSNSAGVSASNSTAQQQTYHQSSSHARSPPPPYSPPSATAQPPSSGAQGSSAPPPPAPSGGPSQPFGNEKPPPYSP